MLAALLTVLLLTLAPGQLDEKARVVSVHDGDTISVSIDGRREKVRLVGIDTPELEDERPEYRQAAQAAREFARAELKGKTITLEADARQPDRDSYTRLLRYVILRDGTNFNEELVRKGYARVYDRFAFTMKSQFKRAESEARREKLGIWTLPPGKARQVPGGAR